MMSPAGMYVAGPKGGLRGWTANQWGSSVWSFLQWHLGLGFLRQPAWGTFAHQTYLNLAYGNELSAQAIFSLVQPRPRQISFLLISLCLLYFFFFLKFKCPSFIQGSHFQILISEIWGFICYFSKKDLLIFETNSPFLKPQGSDCQLTFPALAFISLFLAFTDFPWFLSCSACFQKEC